mmetsp:Transcript_6345/g.9216  ORF Transcript_6345/g.9216 Transcript_6345/m.9216 type:complete len:82 (+) Transcript_6345:2498-2743(+)
MSKIEPQMRSSGLKCMMKAYRPSVDVNFVLDELGFTGRKIDGMLWLKNSGCKFSENHNAILVKESIVNEKVLKGNNLSSLI